jgi:hypothetical protein
MAIPIWRSRSRIGTQVLHYAQLCDIINSVCYNEVTFLTS